MTQTEHSLRHRLSAQVQRLQLNQEQKIRHINKVNQYFAGQVDKLSYDHKPTDYKVSHLRYVDSFRWADIRMDISEMPMDKFTATAGYITEDGRITVGGYFDDDSRLAVFGPKEFQFKPKGNWVRELSTKRLKKFETDIWKIQVKRQAYIDHIEKRSQLKIKKIASTIKDIAAAPVKTGPYEIQAICYSDGIASAMIDNKLLYEGDTINGAKITKIEKNSVHFQAQ
jgi:ribosomal protein L2